MDRRKFLKSSVSTVVAGTLISLPSCTDFMDDGPHHPIPGKWNRGSDKKNGKDKRTTSLFTASDRHEMGEGNNLPSILRAVWISSSDAKRTQLPSVTGI